ncbi:protein of unknown function [Algoriphagus alkaliphilus]|uniref:DUF4920 domain-containing protein n=1 Tax=Algoriphagus alkaliphilus TaxID=279824 RepID=A0A1G5W0N6_9BACT|nr:DUF4920 domain-containing protein [Algoriphagus alkaliphilus]MBA4301598.1 DUF4920 domain-containing protein [Cyclobacterium sp.]SDA51514.1 protein of unknown function [Algoriphagus alkaliphilus]
MKKSILLSVLILAMLSFSCQKPSESVKVETTTKAEPVGEVEVVPGGYGADLAENSVIGTAEMVTVVEASGIFTGKISGEIKEVCTKKGCWFTMDLANGEPMRVTFKDYGFFIPTNSQGFPIILEGVATLTETDVETLKHFAEDQGKSKEEVDAITAPKREITFEATGVLIKDKA